MYLCTPAQSDQNLRWAHVIDWLSKELSEDADYACTQDVLSFRWAYMYVMFNISRRNNDMFATAER